MEIKIKRYLEGAKEAVGLAVLFDVFRASNTTIACLASGADDVIPVGSLEEAYDLKKKHTNHLLFGERNGIPPAGFDADNSPANAMQLNLTGKQIILTTSAGSQGIVHSTKTDQLLIGSFANAEAIIKYIKAEQPKQVSLIAIGNNAVEAALEDEICAQYIKDRLLDQAVNFEEIKNKMLQCDGAKRLRRLKQDQDLAFCTTLDIHNFVPIFDRVANRIIKST